ncbi:hypothetical protein [Paracoccus binzhouensis]|uniref:hypothetical protein n=1 Tax=Paracoccus binzhouensis TaxID=2796149 RepID=UPI0018EF0F9A|nr:hypothetical protein [Paracoccus binzhouensis]
MRHPAPPPTDNVGDVLASIRRLIAQDETGCRIPDQALNALPAREPPRIGPVQTARPAPARITPLVLDSSDLVDVASPAGDQREAIRTPEAMLVAATPPDPAPAEMAQPDSAPSDSAPSDSAPSDSTPSESVPRGPCATAGPEPRPFGDWLVMPLDERSDSPPAAAEPGSTADVQPAESLSGADVSPVRIQPFGPFLSEPAPTTTQMEETMLHANASVTPINPLAEAHAAAEALNRETEPHLFAPQDKDAQKGTHLRGMIREAIRQELQGEIGTRLSRNLQQMIRHEIELALRQMCEQD